MLATLLLASSLAIPFVVQASQTASKTADSAPQVSNPSTREAAVWLEEAKTLTAAIVADHLSFEYRSYDYLLQARLAEAWWKADPARAREHLANARLVTRESRSESPLDALKRLLMCVTVLEVVSRLDTTTGDQMLESILMQAARIGPSAKAIDEQQAKYNLANQLANLRFRDTLNLEQQKKIYRALLGMDSGEATMMLFDFYSQDIALGDQLYREALDAVANRTLSGEQMQMLANLSFPLSPLSDRIKVSQENTERLLKTARDLILQAMDNGLTKESCGQVVMPIILPHFSPEVQAQVRPALEQCKVLLSSPGLDRDIEEALSQQKPETPEDYLQAAKDAKSDEQKAHYKEQAIIRLSQKDPEAAMALMDGMTSAEKEHLPSFEGIRQNLEFNVINLRYKARDYDGLQRLIDHSQFPAQTALSIANFAFRDNPTYAQSLLPFIVDSLADAKVDDSRFYLMALKYIARVSLPMMPVALRDAIKGLNQTTEFIPGLTKYPKGRKSVQTSFWWKLEPVSLPPMFDVMDPRITQLMFDQLRYPLARASFQLWLLNSELKEYEKAQQERVKARSLAEKDGTNKSQE